MSTTILLTKLFAPRGLTHAVARPRLVGRLDDGLATRALTLVCAPAGFGKSSLLGDWAAGCGRPCAWVSLGPGERDVHQFLAYLVAALQAVDAALGATAAALLQAAPPPPARAVLAALLNDVAESGDGLLLVLDDYHLAACEAVDEALGFLVDHLPACMHLALATREEPAPPFARLRARGQLTELRQDDLRFGAEEVAAFLGHTMALALSPAQVATLAARTEGWIAGLQMAALSLQGDADPQRLIQSFSGSHRFLQDFLLEEVLHRQSPAVQSFLLRTSVLDRLCAPLCDAVTQGSEGHATLAWLEQANLFVVPLDAERRWFRYHHLFAELLRERLARQEPAAPLLVRASAWHETHGLVTDALQLAIAADDVARAVRLIDGDGGVPLYFRGTTAPIIQWLQAQPQPVLDRTPRLWLMLAWSLVVAGYPQQMAPKLDAAEAALRRCGDAALAAQLQGQLAALRAWAAVARGDVPDIQAQAARALELLDPDDHATSIAVHCALGVASQFAGNRAAARQAYEQVLAASRPSGNLTFNAVGAMGLASIQFLDNQLHAAARTYRDVLQAMNDPTLLAACEAHLGLARIFHEWNDLESAEYHARLSSQLAAPLECGAGLSADALCARILQLRHRGTQTAALLTRAATAARTRGFTSRLLEVAGLQVVDLLFRGEAAAALELAQRHPLPLATARAFTALGRAADALPVLAAHLAQAQGAGRADEVIETIAVQAVALHALGRVDEALQALHAALLLGEPEGFVRTFVDEGPAMTPLLVALSDAGVLPDYTATLLAALGAARPRAELATPARAPTDALSDRELEILRLIQAGRSNQEIGATLFLSLHTVKWHNQNIFDKLQVKRRTEAVARALALELLRS